MDNDDEPFDDEGEMPWEAHARQAIESATENIELDEVRGVVYMDSGLDHRFNRVTEGFTSAEDVRRRLIGIGEDEWVAYVPFDGGEAVFAPNVEGMVEGILDRHDIETFFERIAPPPHGDELATARELTPPGAGLAIQLDVIDINAELIRYLALHPEKMPI
jgi:hypothetical protein